VPAARPPLALAYHGVARVPWRADRHRLFVRPQQVVRDLERLRSWGYELVTFGDLATAVRHGAGEGKAALTFDDGLRDNLEHLAPLLAAHRAPATVFVVSGWLGGTHPDTDGAPMLRPADLAALVGAGLEVGAHTATHADLRNLADAQIEAEWQACRHVLEDLTGRPVTIGAYPYGAADERVRRATAAAGIEVACRTMALGSWDDPLDLPRQAMGHGSSVLGLRLKRADRYETLMRAPGARRVRRVSRRLHDALGPRSAVGRPPARAAAPPSGHT
jgi:peptidoglycan/xylan/chitin deacetylase (PgdA/CDA1 family)